MTEATIEKQAAEIVQNFSKDGLKGEILRNRLGNKAWPLASKTLGFCKWGALGVFGASAALGNPIPLAGLAVVGASHLAHTWSKGHIKYLQNLTLKNASLLGRSMKNTNIPEPVRKKAIEKFIQKESPLFTANKYIQQNPDMIERMSQGMFAKKNKNFVSFWDANVNALASKKNLKFSDRLAAYKKTFQQWRAAVAEEKVEKLAIKTSQNTGKNLAEVASDVSMKKLMQEAGERTVHAAPKTTQIATTEIAQQVAKTAVQETGEKAVSSTIKTTMKESGEKATQMVQTGARIPLGKKLVEKIGNETLKKTGAKLATLTTLKIGAKKIPILGAVLGAAFATGRAIKGDWTGAGMEFTSGVVSCAPGIGTVASLGIDGALLAKDLNEAHLAKKLAGGR